MFSHSAELYDLIYSSIKDYSGEAAQIATLLRTVSPGCRRILDVIRPSFESPRPSTQAVSSTKGTWSTFIWVGATTPSSVSAARLATCARYPMFAEPSHAFASTWPPTAL